DQRLNRACRGRRRTAAMTRASNDGLTGGESGARSSRAIRSICLSSSLRTVHLAQQLTESIARAHDTHLERRHTNPRLLLRIVVAHVFDVLQEEGFPLLGVELLELAIDLFAPRGSIRRMLFRLIEDRSLVDYEGSSPPPASSTKRPTSVDED